MKPVLKPIRYTVYIPSQQGYITRLALNALKNIDCNFSRLICCLLTSIIGIAASIVELDKNFRHFNWELIIQDKKTSQWYDRRGAITITKTKKKYIK